MPMEDDESDFVWVSEKTTKALTKPQFIISVGERYYLTLAVWEFDIKQAKTKEQKDGCKEIAKIFAHTVPKLEAVKPPEGNEPLWEEKLIGTNPPPKG